MSEHNVDKARYCDLCGAMVIGKSSMLRQHYRYCGSMALLEILVQSLRAAAWKGAEDGSKAGQANDGGAGEPL